MNFKRFVFFCLLLASGLGCAGAPLRFDAEKVAVNPEAFTLNNSKPPVGKWDFWTQDKADNIWLGKSTLRAPVCKADRSPEAPESGLFRVRLPLSDGVYRIEVRGGRAFGIAVGDGAFQKIVFRGVVADRIEVKGGFLELRVANSYAYPEKPGWVYVDHFIAIPLSAKKADAAKNTSPAKWSKSYEAEDVAVEKDRIVSGDRMVTGKWNLWANDPLKKRWSGKKVLRGDVIRTNRKVTDPAAAVLTFRVPLPKNVPCDIRFFGGRTVGVSFDGKFYRRLTNDTFLAEEVKSESGFIEFKIANCYAKDTPKHVGSPYIDRFVVTPTLKITGFPPMLSPEPKVNWFKYSDRYFRIEAEDAVAESQKLTRDSLRKGSWDLWSKDRPANRWSGGKVLRSAPVMKDCSPDVPEAAKLTMRIPVKPGKYLVQAFGGRAFGVSVDGKNFHMLNIRGEIAPELEARNGFLSFQVAACYADPDPKNRGSAYLDFFLVSRIEKYSAKPKLPSPEKPRVEERLDRGAVASKTPEGMLISWRLLKDDPKGIGFDVYRIRNGHKVKLNSTPIQQTCDFLDAEGLPADHYHVAPAAGFKALAGNAVAFPAPPRPESMPYLSYKLSDPASTVWNVGIGDLNGDGKYDFVVKTPKKKNIDPSPRFWYPSPGTFKLEAFLADGTRLWTYDMGVGIERGVWYSPMIVYDFNGDGKAEVVVKASEGDPRDPDGRVTSGTEYLAVLDGMTGKVIARAPWPSRDNFESYNYLCRNQLAMAYLDGKTPAIIALRGTYGTMKAEAWQLKDGKLVNLWKFDNTGLPIRYQGQGAHATICADFDGDGRDEILLGSMVIDDNGEILWSNGQGHPDYIYYTDIIASHPGPEIAHFYETPQRRDGIRIADPTTGKKLWGLDEPNSHINDGYVIDADPVNPGPEIASIDFDIRTPSPDRRWLFSADGRLLKKGRAVGGMRRGIYWDADLEKEECLNVVRDFNGGPVGGATAGQWLMTCDLFGDWREEMITTVPGELRVYTTPIPAMDRRVTLMQSPSYRNSILNNAQGYYSDAQLPYLPTFESDNLSLIVRSGDDGKTRLQLTASASRHAPLQGTLTFIPPTGVTFPKKSWNIALNAGEIWTKDLPLPEFLAKRTVIRAELRTKGKILRGRVPLMLPRKEELPEGTIRIPAALFSAQHGGKVVIAKGRPTAPDGTLVAWDNAGHSLEWKFSVPRAGRYQLWLRRTGLTETLREIKCDGKSLGTAFLKPTGGMGFSHSDWDLSPVKIGSAFAVCDFSAGEHTLTMTNVDGVMQNLAYLYWVPVGGR